MDAVGEQLLGGDERVGLAEQVQPSVGEVGQARVELPAEQVRDREGQLGGPVRVGGVLHGRGVDRKPLISVKPLSKLAETAREEQVTIRRLVAGGRRFAGVR